MSNARKYISAINGEKNFDEMDKKIAALDEKIGSDDIHYYVKYTGYYLHQCSGVIVALEDDKVIGYCSYMMPRSENLDCGYCTDDSIAIDTFAVKKEYLESDVKDKLLNCLMDLGIKLDKNIEVDLNARHTMDQSTDFVDSSGFVPVERKDKDEVLGTIYVYNATKSKPVLERIKYSKLSALTPSADEIKKVDNQIDEKMASLDVNTWSVYKIIVTKLMGESDMSKEENPNIDLKLKQFDTFTLSKDLGIPKPLTDDQNLKLSEIALMESIDNNPTGIDYYFSLAKLRELLRFVGLTLMNFQLADSSDLRTTEVEYTATVSAQIMDELEGKYPKIKTIYPPKANIK